MIVVDASVLADFLLGREPALAAVERQLAGREHEHVHAPELIEPEVLNALRGLARGGAISEQRAGEAVADLGLVRLLRHPHAPLRARVWELRHNLTSYDAAYLALAETLHDPVLLTCDAALAEQARTTLGERGVELVG